MSAAAEEPTALPLPGLPAPAQRPPTVGDLVAAWCTGYSGARSGDQPDPSVLRRVRGVCRTIAKDRTDLDSWRAAWRAALAAGRKGRYDIVGELARPVEAPRGRGNHYIGIAREASHLAALPPLRELS